MKRDALRRPTGGAAASDSSGCDRHDWGRKAGAASETESSFGVCGSPVSPADDPRRHAGGDHLCRQRPRDHCTGPDNGSISDISQHDDVVAYPGARTDVNEPFVTRLIADRSGIDPVGPRSARDMNPGGNQDAGADVYEPDGAIGSDVRAGPQ